MKRLSLLLWILGFYSCSGSKSNSNTPTSKSTTSEAEHKQYSASGIDGLIAQHSRDMDKSNGGHQAFKHVLQRLKDGTMDINDAFVRDNETNGGNKCEKKDTWDTRSQKDKPEAWQTFVIHIVEYGSTPGDHIPYLEYAKAQGADFKVWDMYGRSLLHLVLDYRTEYVASDLTWLLENTDAKDLINEPRRCEGDPTELCSDSEPWSSEPTVQAILKKYGSNHSG